MIVDAVRLSASTYRLKHGNPSMASSINKGDSFDGHRAEPSTCHQAPQLQLPEVAHPVPAEAITHSSQRHKRREHSSERPGRSKASKIVRPETRTESIPDPPDVDEAYQNLLGPAPIPTVPVNGLEASQPQSDQPRPILPPGPVTIAEYRPGDKCWSRMTKEEQTLTREDGLAWNRVWWTGWT